MECRTNATLGRGAKSPTLLLLLERFNMNDSVDIVFSFDTTGSMYPCLTQVRREVEKTCKFLFEEIPDIRIGILTHGDYCDGPLVVTAMDFIDESRKKDLFNFVKNAPATSGGDAPECYE